MFSLLERLCEAEDNKGRMEVIKSCLQTYSIRYFQQDFLHEQSPHANILVRIGSNPSVRCIGFSAHYDKVEEGRGALDNGSGVVVLLHLILELQRIDPYFNAAFMFFDGEEKGYLGSSHYAQENYLNVGEVYNADVIGRGDAIAIADYSYSPRIAGEWKPNPYFLNARAGIIARVLHIPHYTLNTLGSDHMALNKGGIPATLIHAVPQKEAEQWQKKEGIAIKESPTYKLINRESDTLSLVQASTLEMMKEFFLKLALKS